MPKGYLERFRNLRIIRPEEIPIKPKDNQFSEEEILAAASDACSLDDGNIVLIGGQTTLKGITGYKKCRCRSSEIDLAADEPVLDAFNEKELFYIPEMQCLLYMENGLPCGIFCKDIKGLPIFFVTEDAKTVETPQGKVVYARPEKTVAMKFRRGATNGSYRGKDAVDYLTLAAAGRNNGSELDNKYTAGLIEEIACPNCNITEYKGCFRPFGKSIKNIPQKDSTYAAEMARDLEKRLKCR